MKDTTTPAPFPAADGMDLINRIAASLSVPRETFFAFADEAIDAQLQILEDTVDLIRSFTKIHDAEARRRCIAFVAAAADDTAPPLTAADPGPLP